MYLLYCSTPTWFSSMDTLNDLNVTDLTSSGGNDEDKSHGSIDSQYLDISNGELSKEDQV